VETEEGIRSLIREKLKGLSKEKLKKIAALAKIEHKKRKKKAPAKS
jgi:hypothetical protein